MSSYPDEFKKRFKQIQKEISVKNYESALRLADKLMTDCPKYINQIKLLKGSTLWHMLKLSDAEKIFQELVKVSPDNEQISLCLFHVLWDQNNRVDALEEMKRYLKDNKSEEYSRILSEINEKVNLGGE